MNTLCPHAEEHRSAAFAARHARTSIRSLRKLDCYGVSKHEADQTRADLVLRDARTPKRVKTRVNALFAACALLRMRSERTPRRLADEVIE
jgi:hypothetical protein